MKSKNLSIVRTAFLIPVAIFKSSCTKKIVHNGGRIVLSANLSPVTTADAGTLEFYNAFRKDAQPMFPLTQGYITYLNQYYKMSSTPAFPDIPIGGNLSYIQGLAGIGFSHISN